MPAHAPEAPYVEAGSGELWLVEGKQVLRPRTTFNSS
jgi:hypothetical protein